MSSMFEELPGVPVNPLDPYPRESAIKSAADALTEMGFDPDAARSIARSTPCPENIRAYCTAQRHRPHHDVIRNPLAKINCIQFDLYASKAVPDRENARLCDRLTYIAAIASLGTVVPKVARPAQVRAITSRKQIFQLEMQVASQDDLFARHAEARAHILALQQRLGTEVGLCGVEKRILVVAIQYKIAETGEIKWVLTAIDGSSRLTIAHEKQDITSNDVFSMTTQGMKARIRNYNAELAANPTQRTLAAARNFVVPALLLVDYEPYPVANHAPPTAIAVLSASLAREHSEPVVPWTEPAKHASIGNRVITSFEEAGLLSAEEGRYFAGDLTFDEAKSLGFPETRPGRGARIIHTFCQTTKRSHRLILEALRSDTHKNARTNNSRTSSISAGLVMRSHPSQSPEKLKQLSSYLSQAIDSAFYEYPWRITTRSNAQLLAEALEHLERSVSREPGEAALEFSARALYPIIVKDVLFGDRGGTSKVQSSRVSPGVIMAMMRTSRQGLHQMAQALLDHDAARIRAVNANGDVIYCPGGTHVHLVDDQYLRDTFDPKNKNSLAPPRTPEQDFESAREALFDTMGQVRFRTVEVQTHVDALNKPFIEQRGISSAHYETVTSVCALMFGKARVWRDIGEAFEAEAGDEEGHAA